MPAIHIQSRLGSLRVNCSMGKMKPKCEKLRMQCGLEPKGISPKGCLGWSGWHFSSGCWGAGLKERKLDGCSFDVR